MIAKLTLKFCICNKAKRERGTIHNSKCYKLQPIMLMQNKQSLIKMTYCQIYAFYLGFQMHTFKTKSRSCKHRTNTVLRHSEQNFKNLTCFMSLISENINHFSLKSGKVHINMSFHSFYVFAKKFLLLQFLAQIFHLLCQ